MEDCGRWTWRDSGPGGGCVQPSPGAGSGSWPWLGLLLRPSACIARGQPDGTVSLPSPWPPGAPGSPRFSPEISRLSFNMGAGSRSCPDSGPGPSSPSFSLEHPAWSSTPPLRALARHTAWGPAGSPTLCAPPTTPLPSAGLAALLCAAPSPGAERHPVLQWLLSSNILLTQSPGCHRHPLGGPLPRSS